MRPHLTWYMAMTENYQICTQCIMDTTDPDIQFDESGVCHHCTTYEHELSKRLYRGEEAKLKLNEVVVKMKRDGKGHEYDCIIGVSGGVDSTYVAYLVKNLGLRPLAIHFDNGWNSELAVSNIIQTLETLGIELHTYVIDWEEFRSLQLAFLRASVPDGEVPTDHAISALLFHEAARRGIKYVISGMNYATESGQVPSWMYGHMDWRYIKAVNRLFGTRKLKHYPHIGFVQLGWYSLVRRIQVLAILNYCEYDKAKAMEIMRKELGWKYYGGKHYESLYTRFYQGYILPKKFRIDKRVLHLSSLINSGQLTRDEALKELDHNEYLIGGLAEDDKIYVQKKLQLDATEFDKIMQLPTTTFRSYPNSYGFVTRLKKAVNMLRHRGLVAR
jgi:N-acetyl sugar amidotransferase